MDHDEFRATIARLGFSQARLGRLLADASGAPEATTSRLVRRIATGESRVSSEMCALLAALTALHVPPPPDTLRPEDDRDGPCGEALDAALDGLMERAQIAGWAPGEVVAAVLTWVVHSLIGGVGRDDTIETLEDAIELVKLHAPPDQSISWE